MFRPRFSMRLLMIGIAIIAVVIGAELMRRRRAANLEIVAVLTNAQARCRDAIDSKTPMNISIVYVKRGKEFSAAEMIVEITKALPRYEYAASHPWLPVPTDPE
jgi:hypothetical protein